MAAERRHSARCSRDQRGGRAVAAQPPRAEQARGPLDSIDTSTVVGLRDRALISVVTFAFARIGAVVAMRVEDYYPKGKRGGCVCRKKAANAARCRRIIIWSNASTPTYRGGQDRRRGQGAPVPLRRRPHRRTDRVAHEPHRRMADGPAPGGGAWHEGPDRLSYVSCDRHHGLPRSRRHAGERTGDGRARKSAHDEGGKSSPSYSPASGGSRRTNGSTFGALSRTPTTRLLAPSALRGGPQPPMPLCRRGTNRLGSNRVPRAVAPDCGRRNVPNSSRPPR